MALRVQDSHTPRVRPAAMLTRSRNPATTTMPTRPNHVGNSVADDSAASPAPLAYQYHAGYPAHATRVRLCRTDTSAADAAAALIGSCVSMAETLEFPMRKRKGKR